MFTVQDRGRLLPGETAQVFVTLSFPEGLMGKLHPDQAFLLHEGYHPIGKGRILALLHFEKHGEEARQLEEDRRFTTASSHGPNAHLICNTAEGSPPERAHHWCMLFAY